MILLDKPEDLHSFVKDNLKVLALKISDFIKTSRIKEQFLNLLAIEFEPKKKYTYLLKRQSIGQFS